MDETFLRLYEEELGHIREVGAEFGRQYPRIAGRLAIGPEGCDDPFVERMIEGFAFLAARTRMKLDAEFPKFCESLLETIHPLLLAPVPSMSIVELTPDSKLTDAFHVQRGTALSSHLGPEQDTRCEFRTGHEVMLRPIQLNAGEEARYFTRDIERLRLPSNAPARAALRLGISHLQGDKALSSLEDFGEITFHIAGNLAPAGALYEEILAHCTHVHLRPTPSGLGVPAGRTLRIGGPECAILPVGFEAAEALLPPDPRIFDGHRLLREFSVLPERFLFFRIEGEGLAGFFRECGASSVELIFLFDRAREELGRYVDERRFRLFCTPVINLFERRADQVQLGDGSYDAHLVVDRTRPTAFEVFDVIDVKGIGGNAGERVAFEPFYRCASVPDAGGGFFAMRREPRRLTAGERRRSGPAGYLGSEVHLSVVDGKGALHRDEITGLSVRVRCSNRHLAMRIPIGGHETDFFTDAGMPVARARCLVAPTRPCDASTGDAPSWKLVSHLSLNYLSLCDDEGGIAALREILSIYTGGGADDEAHWTSGLVAVSSRPVVRRHPGAGPVAFVRGLEVTLTVDESQLAGASAYILGAVLGRFFRRHVSINSFVDTRLVSVRRGEIALWSGMAGKLQIL